MKVNVPRKSKQSNNGFAPPPIPLERPAAKELEKDQYLALKLKSVPGRASSGEYTLNVPYFQSGEPEEWLKFMQSLNKVFVGQSLTSAPNKFAMARRLLAGDSLMHFDKMAASLTNDDDVPVEDEDNFKKALNAVTETILNKKALSTQKRYMRRILRKPKDMRIRMYCARFSELNKYLESFPPYNGPNQCLPQDEILEHLEFAIPNSWQKQMVIQGFNTLEHTIEEFIEFCERMEFGEEVYDTSHPGQKANTKSGAKSTGSKQSAGNSPLKRKLDKYCLYHGHNSTHITDECKVLKSQVERMARSHKNVGAGKYARSSEGSSSDNKKQLQSFKAEIVKSVVDSLTKKGGESRSSKKRRVINMEEFNMEQFRDLKVSSEESHCSNESDDSNDS